MESRVDPATSVRRRLVSTRSISFEKAEVGSKKLLIQHGFQRGLRR